MRASVVATRLARRLGLGEADVADAYWVTLLRHVGCTASSHEYAVALGGDDVAARGRGDMVDTATPREVMAYLWELAPSGPLGRRIVETASVARRAKAVSATGARANCEVGAQMANRFGLASGVVQAFEDVFERWDGRGSPRGRRGDAIALPARVAAVAFAAAMFETAGGSEAAVQAIGRWRGRALDPSIAATFLRESGDILTTPSEGDAWEIAVDAEPEPTRFVSDHGLDDVAAAFAHAVDLKSVFLQGHSSGVALLAEAAGRAQGLPETDVATVRRAALFHDLGRAGVPSGMWERAGPLSRSEWELVRLHPYHTERILSRSPALSSLAAIAGSHHERLDGSGYHRGVSAPQLGGPARILAAADVYHALTQARPHRPALSPEDARRALEALPLDRAAVAAVLDAAGQPHDRARSAHPAGLTEREVEVLRLLARGRAEKQIARALSIAPSTVHTHVVHIYEKSGVSTRAAAAMFAMEHGLVGPQGS